MDFGETIQSTSRLLWGQTIVDSVIYLVGAEKKTKS